MTIDSTTTSAQSTVEEARARAERIRSGMENLHALRTDIADAYLAMDWNSLGYDTWDAYVEAEFIGPHLRLPRDERRELVGSLSKAGMSTRAIAAATGMGKSQIAEDISGVRKRTPDHDTQSNRTASSHASVKGIDGKTYTKPPVSDLISNDQLAELNGNSPSKTATSDDPIDAEVVEDKSMPAPNPYPQRESKPRRKAIADTARSVALDGTSWTRKVRKLLNDDRFTRNRDGVGNAMRAEVDEVHRAVNEFKQAVDGAVYEPR